MLNVFLFFYQITVEYVLRRGSELISLQHFPPFDKNVRNPGRIKKTLFVTSNKRRTKHWSPNKEEEQRRDSQGLLSDEDEPTQMGWDGGRTD